MRRAVPLLAALALLAGCSETTGGSGTAAGGPTAGGSTTGGSTTGGPTAGGSTAPASSSAAEPVDRPESVDVGKSDPCALLTEAQRAQLGLDRPPLAGTSSVYRSPTCDFSREDRAYGVRITTVTTTGIAWYTDGSFDVEAEEVRVAGFPAVLGRNSGDRQTCFLGVDVSAGQMLDVQVASFEGTPQDELCGLAPKVAEAAVGTLVNG
ncbi:DUF3558 domain-containing protein [Saccharothrix sp. Mg75]|uniref:DUF3558 domain-containing protein n=1 Tax=Saccharothrix sp. Mg75 TaxID=3445357 RepID=UPI003EEA9471